MRCVTVLVLAVLPAALAGQDSTVRCRPLEVCEGAACRAATKDDPSLTFGVTLDDTGDASRIVSIEGSSRVPVSRDESGLVLSWFGITALNSVMVPSSPGPSGNQWFVWTRMVVSAVGDPEPSLDGITILSGTCSASAP